MVKLYFLFFLLVLNQSYFYSSLIESEDESTKRVIQRNKIEENRLKCLSNENNHYLNSTDQAKSCPMTFDLILCWDETPVNQWAIQPCPIWFIGFENSKKFAKRFCQPDGTWVMRRNMSYTDYTGCIEEDFAAQILTSHLKRLKLIAKIGSIISLASLVIAMILLISFKRLHCARNILHCNLFGSFLLFSIIHLIKETFWVNSVGFPKDVIIQQNLKLAFNPNITHWECKTLMAFFRYAESSNHVMIFAEALYLNTLVSVSTFSESNHFKLYITLGWVGPLLWIIPFVTLMSIFGEKNSCWNTETSFSYLYVVPQILLIFLNFALFINIMRILRNKLRKNRLTESKHYRFKKLAKSTLILLPMFSLYYIAFSIWQPFVRGKLPLELELIRLYFEIICSSFQGLAISLIYGFFNSEVRNEVINQIERRLLLRYPNMRRFSTMLAKDRNSCASLGNDRFRASHKFKESKIKKIVKNYSVKDNDKDDLNNNDVNISMKSDDINKSEPNRKKVVLNLDKNTEKKSRSSIFKRRKKESNSTITSSLPSSKGSKGTIRLDSLDVNIYNMGEDSETLSRANSSLKEKYDEPTEIKINKKNSYVDFTEKNSDEQKKLIEH